MAVAKMALAVIWISVIAGAALGLWQRMTARTTGPIRTFAVVAASLVVGLSLLPHAIASEGIWGLFAAIGGFIAIPTLERLVTTLFRGMSAHSLRLEVGFAGLMVHRFGDGVVMSVEGHGHELLWALGAHEIPIVALVTLAYARRGVRTALWRAALLGLASSLGYFLVRSMPGTWHEWHGWADAVAAGILVHIVAYEALAEKLQTRKDRAIDVLAAAFGLFVVLLPDVEEHAAAPSIGQGLLGLTLAVAPVLCLGLLASAGVVTLARRHSAGTRHPAPDVSSPVASPGPGLEALTLSTWLLGWPFAVAQLACGGALAFAARLTATTDVKRDSAASAERSSDAGSAALHAEPDQRFAVVLDQLISRVGGWILLGLLGASYIERFVPSSGALASLSMGWQGALLGALSIASSVCTPAAVPLAAALVGKALPPGVALGGLVLGPALKFIEPSLAAAGVGRARRWLSVAVLALLAWGLVTLAALLLDVSLALPRARAAGVLEWASLGLLGLLVIKTIWQVGIRCWLGASLSGARAVERRGHVHVPAT